MTINSHQILHFISHFFQAKRKGHGVHSPFVYKLCEEVIYNQNSYYDFIELERLRAALLNNEQEIEITDLGAGSKTFKTKLRKIKSIAAKGISSSRQSQIFYKLINVLGLRYSIELGTSLGLNTMYLAKACKKGQVLSLEGSANLIHVAKQLVYRHEVNNIHFIEGNFDDTFSKALELNPALDFLYIDGNHSYEATLRYFESALSYKNKHSVFVFDDIYWSKGMSKAWEMIKKNPQVTLSVDCFYFGMIFFRPEILEKQDLKLYL